MSPGAEPAQDIATQIDAAATVADLSRAGRRIDEMIIALQASGIRIERIAQRVSQLNAALFSRLWSLTAPLDLVANSCLLVMGSEGRGEQILKTDQDNALLLRDGFDCADLEEVTRRFSAALADFGYPPCAGNIMLTNPLWRQSLSGFKDNLRIWLYGRGDDADAQGPMRLAIFLDAAPVAGDATLLQALHAYLRSILAGQEIYLARFAAAADQFHDTGHWWTRFTAHRDEQTLDLKKLGIFPIVHGARALALEYDVSALGTAQRLAALVEQGHMEWALARDLSEALHLLMALRLQQQLHQRAGGMAANNLLRPAELSALERETLQAALGVVKTFRAFLRLHFRFDLL